MKDHSAITLGPFKGLYQRGDPDNVPLDHFENSNNVKRIGNDWTTRDGIDIHQDVIVPLKNVVRIYNYPTTTANTLLVLVITDAGIGEIYHIVNSTTIYGPILTVATMTDFAFVPYAGRAYITPFTSYAVGDLFIEKGIEDEFLYVYLGAGIAARKAAGAKPTGTLTAAIGPAGFTDPGFKVFGVVFETDTGWLSPPAAFVTLTTLALNSVSFAAVPTGIANSGVVKRHIVATKNINGYNGNTEGYQFFFIPGATINDNTTTVLNTQSWFDAALLEDASHLLDNYAEIPAGVALSIYHDRLALSTTFDDPSIVLLSAPGEPEAISQLDGLLIVPPDGNPITNHGELRDVFYVFKRSKTISFNDNGEEPSSWESTVIDNALGCPVHGIATVLDSGNASIDYFIVTTYAGVSLFNGRYLPQELSWKIEDLWKNLERKEFRHIQLINAVIQKWILVVTPDGNILCGDYANGFAAKEMSWTPWTFEAYISCIAIVNIDEIIIGADYQNRLIS